MAHGAISWIEIPVDDLDRDPGFYQQVFGWTITRDPNFPTYVIFSDNGGQVGGGMYKEIRPAPEGGPHIHITVDDIDTSLKAISDAGGQITQQRTLIDENVGWWAGFKDPAGNRMFLYQRAQAD